MSDNFGSSSSMKYCKIEQGNEYDIYCNNTVQPAVFENCLISDAAGDGLKLYNSAVGPIRSSTFRDNGNTGIYVEGNNTPVIGNDTAYTCNLFGNAVYNIYNNSSNDIDARYNYWATGDSAMIAATIFDKYDDNSKGEVIFADFAQLPSITADTTLLSGYVWYHNSASTAMANALMEIFNFEGTPIANTTTNASGHYSFAPFTAGNYTLDISPSDSWGGVNSTDALLILKHFAHLDTLTGMKLAAAQTVLH